MSNVSGQTHGSIDTKSARKNKLFKRLTSNPLTLGIIFIAVILSAIVVAQAAQSRKSVRFAVNNASTDGAGTAFQSDGSVIFNAVNPPTGGMWKPTADKPLALHWVLSTEGSNGGSGATIDLNDPVQMGLRDSRTGATLPAPDVYDIDGEKNSAATVQALHNLPNKPKVICYVDMGVYETYRSDAASFPKSVIGKVDEGWDSSYWLDIRQISILEPIMKKRLKEWCADKKFDSVEPDEITNYSNNSGFPLTYQDQINYNKKVAQWAHELGLSIGLKGDIEQAKDLAGTFDWALTEECYMYAECSDGDGSIGLKAFTNLNKAVWIAEYPVEYPNDGETTFKTGKQPNYTKICNDSKANKWNTVFFALGLPKNGGRNPCPTTSPTQW